VRIAVVGPLTLPAAFGGVTRHCEELYTRLAARGHEITVFGRSRHVGDDHVYKGIRVRGVRSIPASGWETFGYGMLAALRSSSSTYDVVHFQGIASAGFCWVPRARGRRIAVTVHSVDWAHGKWGRLPRSYLRWVEGRALASAGVVIAVSRSLRDELRTRHPGREIHYLPNGIEVPAELPPPDAVRALGLEPGRYVLFVGRLVPEKGVHFLVEAHRQMTGGGVPLAIVGGPRYSEAYADELRRSAGEGVRFLGFRSGEELRALYAHAAVFVAPSLHEGFNLTLLEAMSLGSPIVASDIPAHRELLGGKGLLARPGDARALADAVSALLADTDRARRMGAEARAFVAASAEYDWDAIAASTERLLAGLR
jgi:glycosyltransferase involved in cell wall biosynthesis